MGLPQKVPQVIQSGGSGWPIDMGVYGQRMSFVAPDSHDNVFVLSSIRTGGTSTEFAAMLTATGNSVEEGWGKLFIAKFDSCGNLLKTINIPLLNDIQMLGNCISIDDDDNVYIRCKTSIKKYDNDLNLIWGIATQYHQEGSVFYYDSNTNSIVYNEKIMVTWSPSPTTYERTIKQRSTIDGSLINSQYCTLIGNDIIKGNGNFYYSLLKTTTGFKVLKLQNIGTTFTIVNEYADSNPNRGALLFSKTQNKVFLSTLNAYPDDCTLKTFDANLNLLTSQNGDYRGTRYFDDNTNSFICVVYDFPNHQPVIRSMQVSGSINWSLIDVFPSSYIHITKSQLNSSNFFFVNRSLVVSRILNSGTSASAGRHSLNETEEDIPSRNNIFPNPFQNELNIAITAGARTVSAVSLYNALGNKLSIHYQKTATQYSIDTASLVKGYYYLEISYEDGSVQKTTVIKQ